MEDFHSLFSDCNDQIAELAAQNFGCRIVAGILMLAASDTPGCLDGVVRSVQLSWKDSGGLSRTGRQARNLIGCIPQPRIPMPPLRPTIPMILGSAPRTTLTAAGIMAPPAPGLLPLFLSR